MCPPSFLTIVGVLFGLSIPLGQILLQSGVEGAVQLLAGAGPVLLMGAILWDQCLRETGRRRLDPGPTIIITVLIDILAPALGEIMFLAVVATRNN